MKRKIVTKISACALALCLACVGFAMPSKKVSAASSQPAQLLYAHDWYQAGDYSGYITEGDIDVQSTGTNKQVTVYFTTDGVNWKNWNAAYEKADSNNPGYDVWSFDIQPFAPKSFYIKYVVDGTTYLDNNNGANYYFATYGSENNEGIVLGKDNVKYVAPSGYQTFENRIFVKNLGYDKNVGIRYSKDNWATFTDSNAAYLSSLSSSIDMFSVPAVPDNALFAVYYTVNGATYWDNNYGNNYYNS